MLNTNYPNVLVGYVLNKSNNYNLLIQSAYSSHAYMFSPFLTKWFLTDNMHWRIPDFP